MYPRQDPLSVGWFGTTSDTLNIDFLITAALSWIFHRHDNADLLQAQLLMYLGTPSGPLQTAERSVPCFLPPNSILMSAE